MRKFTFFFRGWLWEKSLHRLGDCLRDLSSGLTGCPVRFWLYQTEMDTDLVVARRIRFREQRSSTSSTTTAKVVQKISAKPVRSCLFRVDTINLHSSLLKQSLHEFKAKISTLKYAETRIWTFKVRILFGTRRRRGSRSPAGRVACWPACVESQVNSEQNSAYIFRWRQYGLCFVISKARYSRSNS